MAGIDPKQANMKVETHVPPQPPPAANAPTPAQMAAEMVQRQTGHNISPETLQVLMQMMLPMVGEMARTMAIELRKPTPEEEAKLAQEKERQKMRSVQAAKAGELEAAMIKSQQTGCQHLKPNGEHTFRGQVHSNGWAQIKCQRCLVKFNVRPLPEHVANGLNLSEIRGLTIEHLRSWQANSAEIDRNIRANQDAMRRHAGQFANMAPSAGL